MATRRGAEALVSRGFDVEVICMGGLEGPRRQVVNGVKVIALPRSRRKSSKLRYVFDYGAFFVHAAAVLCVRHIRRPYAVVQVTTMPDFLVFAAVVPKLAGSRVLAFMHEPSPELAETLLGPGLIPRVLRVIEQRVLRFADHSIAVTEQLKERFVERGADPSRISVVLNCADPTKVLEGWSRPEDPPNNGRFRVICHGTIEDRYGQDTIVAAAHRLREEMPELEVILTGSGSAATRLAESIQRLGLDDVVRFEGWVSRERLNDLLHTADVGVVAQKASAYSHLVHTYKMVDYWIFGLAVIASRLRAVSELYDERVLEYYEAGDPTDLARAIWRLRDDPERRAELARGGRQAQERFGWAVQKRAYLDVFDKLLSERERSAITGDDDHERAHSG
jgi:glycosyltransferase involved in cell wall biosynthesis